MSECAEKFPYLSKEIKSIEQQLNSRRSKSICNANEKTDLEFIFSLSYSPQTMEQKLNNSLDNAEDIMKGEQVQASQYQTNLWRSSISKTFKFSQIDEEDFVQQCCLIDYDLFSQMQIRELFSDKRLKKK